MQAEVVPELVVHERMSQYRKVEGAEEKKKVKGWSTEMKDKSREDREIDTEEMNKWRSMSQEEMDEWWKRLAEKMEEEVQDKYKVDDRRGLYSGRGSLLEWSCMGHREGPQRRWATSSS